MTRPATPTHPATLLGVLAAWAGAAPAQAQVPEPAVAAPAPLWAAMAIVVVLAYGVSWLVARPLLFRHRPAPPAQKVAPPGHPRLQAGPLVLDPVSHQVQVEGRRLDLTTTEFKLLVHLVEHPGQVLSRDELLRSVWGYATSGYSRTVDTHVQRLREKLGEASPWIETVRGAGYRFRSGEG
ncbi:MAG: winged helix-turn-helix transcriptional regulator [Candidatus Latescibacteria bacterium]|nr:winged helix-turn-helix transcriptional regulator [Candidatus Latescibacterota bacterium]